MLPKGGPERGMEGLTALGVAHYASPRPPTNLERFMGQRPLDYGEVRLQFQQ
jgi:hypothetical protein